MGQMHPRKPFSTMNDVGEVRDKYAALKHRAQQASQSLQEQVRASPGMTLAAVAGTSLVVGSVLGSRIGRAAVFCVVGYGLSKLIGPGKAIDPANVMRGWTEPGKD